MTVPEPVTSMPRERRRKKSTPSPPWLGDQPKDVPTVHRAAINLDSVLKWIASVGKEDDASSLLQYWEMVAEALKRNGLKGNRFAIKSLPEPSQSTTFNGSTLTRFLKTAGKQESDTLQKLFAAMRLRIRHAAWV